MLVIRGVRSRLSAQQAGDPRPLWGYSGVASPDGAMSGP